MERFIQECVFLAICMLVGHSIVQGYQVELALYFIGFVVVLSVAGLFIDCLTDL